MLDLTTETAISIPQAAKLVPPVRQGRPTHTSTISRWHRHGVEGVRLEAARVGGRWVTSVQAVQRFMQVLTEKHNGQSVNVIPPDPGTVRAREAEAARLDRVEKSLIARGA